MATTNFVDEITVIEPEWCNDVDALAYQGQLPVALDVAGDTSVGDNASLGYNATDGAVLTGQGSTNDVTIKNDADAIVAKVATGTTIFNFTSPIEGGASHLQTEIATTSGTTKDFTGIPSWVKKITIMLEGVSLDGDADLLVQIGDAGGIEDTNYVASACGIVNAGNPTTTSYTTGFGIEASNAETITGTVVLTLKDAANFTWVASGVLHHTSRLRLVSGVKSLSAALTQIRLTSVGTPDDFDAGSMNIMWE